jgi:3-phosphoshikimate 1-carboxyvinyltransferase
MEVLEDQIRILPGLCPPQEVLDGHNDHRIVMALCVLLTLTGGRIRGAEAVAKSLPDFFDRLKELGIKVKSID